MLILTVAKYFSLLSNVAVGTIQDKAGTAKLTRLKGAVGAFVLPWLSRLFAAPQVSLVPAALVVARIVKHAGLGNASLLTAAMLGVALGGIFCLAGQAYARAQASVHAGVRVRVHAHTHATPHAQHAHACRGGLSRAERASRERKKRPTEKVPKVELQKPSEDCECCCCAVQQCVCHLAFWHQTRREENVAEVSEERKHQARPGFLTQLPTAGLWQQQNLPYAGGLETELTVVLQQNLSYAPGGLET